MKIDDWFKPLLLFFIIIFLIIFYWHSQNGRYTFHFEASGICAADSRTGIVYAIGSDNAFKFELPLGKKTTSPIREIPKVIDKFNPKEFDAPPGKTKENDLSIK